MPKVASLAHSQEYLNDGTKKVTYQPHVLCMLKVGLEISLQQNEKKTTTQT